MDRVRIGIVGVGNIATLNVPGYLEHEQCDVVALCDPRADVLERRWREWGVDRGYTELDALLADPDIDAVEILSPTPLHAEHVIAALRAGQARVVQKPIANTVGDARAHGAGGRRGGRDLPRHRADCCYYPPLRKARDLIRVGRIGDPTVVRIKTVVGRTESEFQANLDPAGYTWRFNDREPRRPSLRRRHAQVRDGAVARRRATCAACRRSCARARCSSRRRPSRCSSTTAHDLLGMMEVSYAPDMFIRSDYYGADEFFEIQGTRGFIWVTRLCGNLHVDLPPLVLYEEDGRQSSFAELDASYDGSFRRSRPGRSSTACSRARRPTSIAAEGRSRRCSSPSPCTRRRTSAAPSIRVEIEESVTPERLAAERREDARATSTSCSAREAARAERLGGGVRSSAS